MSVLNSNPFLIASGSPNDPAVPLQRSLRFRGSASPYLTRTPATTSNRQKWTFSTWAKLGNTVIAGNYLNLLATQYTTVTPSASILRLTTSGLEFISWDGGTVNANLLSTQTFRDPAAWYHLVVAVNTTEAVASNRIKLYVNGVQVTAFTTATYPALNYNTYINVASLVNTIGGLWINSGGGYAIAQNYDGYLTEINFVDGQALTPSSFGGYNAGTNVWEVRKYSGTYGTNGFYLPFTNPASIGADSSGNGNNWTASAGIQTSNSALVTYDSMLDVPTLTSATNANFAVLNPLQAGNAPSNGNLSATTSGTAHRNTLGTFFFPAAKFYYEISVPSIQRVSAGMATASLTLTAVAAGQTSFLGFYGDSTGSTVYNGSSSLFVQGAVAANDVYQFCVDATTGNAWFGRNNTFYSSAGAATGNPATGVNPTWTGVTLTQYAPEAGVYDAGTTANANFGQRPFTYTPPSGFKSLNTYNLPEPTIPRGDKYFKQYLYTGNGGGQQIGEIQKPASLFNLDRSLRFRSSNSAYLSRTWGTPTNGQKFTCSFWLKRGALGSITGLYYQLFGGGTAAANAGGLQFTPADVLNFYWENGTNCNLSTTNVYKNPSLWYHIVVVQDTTQVTAANRVQIYVNGVLQTLTGTYPTQNASATFNSATIPFGIMAGKTTVYSLFTDGYLADFYWIDGQAPDASNFGQYDGNNYWTPKVYSGTYGAQGFHLEFEDYSNNTATTIGKDTSGQGNNWTPTGIVVSPTTSASNDSMVDVPTLTSESVANFATINPLNGAGTALTISAGNLNYLQGSSLYGQNVCTLPIRSKTYFEITVGSPVGAGRNMYAGVGSSALASAYSTANYFGTDATAWSLAYSNVTAYISNNGVATAQSGTVAGGDIFMYAVDPANGKIWFGRNGTWYSGDPSAGTGASYSNLPAEVFPVVQAYNSGTHSINFGQRPFTHTPPTGFKSLNSFNVAEVTGDVETPDFVWIKSRNATADHTLFNSVTGVGKYSRSNSNLPTATDVNSLIQFNKNGVLLGNSTTVNTLNTTYVANAWKASNSTITNTDGTVTSQVRANQESGISIATFTTPASGNFTVGHGLGKTPSMVILKNTSGTDNYYVYNKNFATPATYYLILNTTGVILSSASLWGSTLPTSSVITLGTGGGIAANATGILYSFVDIEGFSKFGTYKSNNDPNGPFVYTGFRPRWLMVKRAMTTAGAAGWFMYDAARNTYNVMDKYLFAEGTAGENTLAVFDFTSNGFKIRSNNVHVNTTAGDSYIYMAFAENPFKYALAR